MNIVLTTGYPDREWHVASNRYCFITRNIAGLREDFCDKRGRYRWFKTYADAQKYLDSHPEKFPAEPPPAPVPVVDKLASILFR